MERSENKGYKKVKRLYYPLTLYFECAAEKEKVIEYAKSIDMSMRQYILNLIFEKKEPEILIDKQRKERRMYKNQKSEKGNSIRYELLIPSGEEGIFKEKAEQRDMDMANYTLARIRADLKEKGVILDYQESFPFLILYKSGEKEQDNYANTNEEAMQIIEKIKKEGATDILLVDTVNRKRKEF